MRKVHSIQLLCQQRFDKNQDMLNIRFSIQEDLQCQNLGLLGFLKEHPLKNH